MTAASFGHALDVVTRVRGVRGAMLVSVSDGLVVAEHLMEVIKGPAVAALTASLASRLRHYRPSHCGNRLGIVTDEVSQEQ